MAREGGRSGFRRRGNLKQWQPRKSVSHARDWRSRFFSVYVGNLSLRVPRSALWNTFKEYGWVVDVFIQENSVKCSTYAFVRFKEEAAMEKAIRYADGRCLDGLSIRVKQAVVRGKRNGLSREAVSPKRISAQSSSATRDERTYLNASKGKAPVCDGPSAGSCVARVDFGGSLKNGSLEVPVLFVDASIVRDSIQWLERTAIGRLKRYSKPKVIQESLSSQGIQVDVSAYGGLSLVLSFVDRDQMDHYLLHFKNSFDVWFDYIKPWDHSVICNEKLVWLTIVGVPLQLWQLKFFEKLRNMVGTFISADLSTSNRCRFDSARILVAMENDVLIPQTVMVKVGICSFAIELFLAPAYDFVKLSTDKQLPSAGGQQVCEESDSSSSGSLADRVSEGMVGSTSKSVRGGVNNEGDQVVAACRSTQNTLKNATPANDFPYDDDSFQPTRNSPSFVLESVEIDGGVNNPNMAFSDGGRMDCGLIQPIENSDAEALLRVALSSPVCEKALNLSPCPDRNNALYLSPPGSFQMNEEPNLPVSNPGSLFNLGPTE